MRARSLNTNCRITVLCAAAADCDFSATALPHKTKITTLTQEVIRRMRNTCRKVGKRRRAEILSRFTKKMKKSGYNGKVRRNVLLAGLKGYCNMVKEEEAGGRKVNRPRWEGAGARRIKKLGGKSNWFKKKNKQIAVNISTVGDRLGLRPECGNRNARKTTKKSGKERITTQEIETVMFVPQTPGGELAKLLQEADDKFTAGKGVGKIKMIERGGSTLKQLLCRSNPWATDGCGRGEQCFPCKEEGGAGGNCQLEGVVYKITCQECKMRGVDSEYVGESSRTAFLRGSEHLEDLRKKNDSSPLWKHCMEEHGGQEVKFKMRVVRGHKTPLTRQIQESVEIESSSANIVMNSKCEYNGSRIPRIVIEVGDRLETESWPGQDGKNVNRKVNKDTGSWQINNLKKRKRDENGKESSKNEENQSGNPKCGSTEPGNQESHQVTRLTKKRRLEAKIVKSKMLQIGQSVTEGNRTECGNNTTN